MTFDFDPERAEKWPLPPSRSYAAIPRKSYLESAISLWKEKVMAPFFHWKNKEYFAQEGIAIIALAFALTGLLGWWLLVGARG